MPCWSIKLVTMEKIYVTQGRCAHGMYLQALSYPITGIVKWNQLSEMSSITNALKWSYFDSMSVLLTCGKLEKCTNMSAQGCWSPVLPCMEPHFRWTPLAHLQPALPFLSEWGSLEPRGHVYPVLLPLDHTAGAQDLGKALSSEAHLPRVAWASVLCPRLKG